MSKLKVFDETVEVTIIRDGKKQSVRFCDLEEGDHVVSNGYDFIVGDDAHHSGDATYDGWLVYDTKGTDYYPEDFGARLVQAE